MPDVTAQLARFIATAGFDDVPANVRHEARRALLNWLGCAIGGSHAAAVDLMLNALSEFAGPTQATVINRKRQLDLPSTAIVNAISSSVLDFDDTHLRTVIHPSVPVAAAAVALAEHVSATGAELMHAFILGVETECRIGNALSPSHYEAGWHVTATCGVIGAAAACSKLLKLDGGRTTYAISMAASQAGGLSEMLGSMTRMVNMGHAARNGLLSAWYAAKGITSSQCAIEAPRGFANAFSSQVDLSEITDGLGETWELTHNAYKPYPCGIVVHPIIDGCLELRARHDILPDAIDHIAVSVHPLVLRITGHPAPADGLRSKVSAQHAAAVAMIYGAAGVQEFTDDVVHEASVIGLRSRVELRPQDDLGKDAAAVAVTLRDGTTHTTHVSHARGSTERPLSDHDLESKFRALAAWGQCDADPDAIIDCMWHLDQATDGGIVARQTCE